MDVLTWKSICPRDNEVTAQFCDNLTLPASIICILCLNEGSQFDNVNVFVCSCGI